ncbi:MAG: ATP-binding protein, partial [Actinomycetota bacterium]
YYRAGEVARAIDVCDRYLKEAADLGLDHPLRIAELRTAGMGGGLQHVDGPSPRSSTGESRARRSLLHRVYLSALWDLTPTIGGPLPAELHLIIEGYGGEIHKAGEVAVDVSFFEARPALEAALALHERLGGRVARVGLDVRDGRGMTERFEAPPRARARLLAAAAREGQVLVCGAAHIESGSLPIGARLRPLGEHRLNALGPAVGIHQVTSPRLPPTRREPRWFDEDPVHGLLAEPSRFIGRERELAAITDALARSRLATLTGAPGSGKTRLATRVASGLAGEYKDGVWFTPLQPLPSGGLVPGTLAEALRMPRPATVNLGALVRYLSDKHALLVIDNCEHVLSECRETVDALLLGCPNISILATSREALYSEFENVVPVPPMDLPPRGSTATILRNDAVVLLFDRMTSVSLEHLDDEVAEAAGRICRAVEGIPLALVLAAGRASEIGIKPLADVLDEVLGEGEGIEILGGGRSADRPDRATLGGTLEWSYRMLTAREQMVFDSLSVFRGRFSVDDALAVCIGRKLTRAEIVAALDRLVQTSLLNAEPHSVQRGTFRLLQPVRDFASRKLASRPRTATIVRRRHAEHFLRIAEETEHLVRGPQDRAALELLDGALADLYAAMRWALATKESDTALRLVNCMWVYWLVRGRGAEAIPMIEAALDLDRTISRDMAMAQMACCQLYWVSGEFGRIRERSREILAVGEALGDDLVWALGVLGFVAMDMFDIADDFVPLRAQEILPSFRRIGDHWYGGQALQTAGGALWHRGDYGRAEALYGESVLGFRKLGHPTTMNSLRGHALMLALLGNLDEAHAELESALVAAYEEGDFVGVAEALCFRGAIARYEDDHAGARAFYRRALSTARDAGYGWMVFWSLDRLVDTDELGLHVAAERFAASIQLLAFTEVMSRHTGLNLAPRERQDHARDLQRARARVGEAAFETAFERGQRLSLDEAIELGLSLDSSTPATT